MAILINDTTPRSQYTATSGQTVFSIPFEFFSNSDIAVYQNAVLKTITTHYTLTGAGVTGGGSLTLVTGATVGDVITIVRDIPVKRVTDFPTSGPFNIDALNTDLDRLTAMIQERENQISRVVSLAQTDAAVNLYLPTAANRASKVMAFDSTGNIIVAQELGTYRGNWASGNAYILRDIIKDTSNANIYICVAAHTSTGSQPISSNANSASWTLLVDAATATTASSSASASASAASSSASAASSSASAASSSASSASSSASNASSSASSASASASTATTQASNASTSATNAASSASSASTSASNASTSATSASNSAAAAAATLASGFYSAVQDKSANYTVVSGDAGDLIRVTTTSGAKTITLPQISTVTDGFKISVVKWTSDANAVIVARSGSDTINGGTTSSIGSQYANITFVADYETNQWFAATSGLGTTNTVVDIFSGTGSQTAFTLSGDPTTINNTYVYISGVYQNKATYSLSTTTLTFTTAPPSGTSNIEVIWTVPLLIGAPNDGTVTNIKVSSSSTLYNRINDTVSVKDYGAIGNGIADDTTAIRNAISGGRTVYFPSGTYRTTSQIDIPANTKMYGFNAKVYCNHVGICFNLTGNYITIKDLEIYGDWSGYPYNDTNVAIYGQLNTWSPLVVTYLYYVQIENCTIYNFGQAAVQIYSAQYVKLINNNIYNAGVHGILLVSVNQCLVTNNLIQNIGANRNNYAYGISLSRLSSATISGNPNTPISLANGPISANVVISNNYIQDVVDEVAIDLHSGDNITISGNVARNVRIGVNLEHATASSYYATCTNISITGNSFSGLTTAGKVCAGVFVDAQSGASEIATGIAISGNTFNYFGLDTADPFKGANNAVIYVNYASGVSITGNTFNNSYGRCVGLDTLTYNCNIIGNTVTNLAIANSTQNAFETLSGSARGTINGNTMYGSSGYLVKASTINSGYGLKVGGENIVVGGALMATQPTQANIRGGNYLTSPRVIVVWDNSGTITNTVFEDINYSNSTPTITKNGTGDFTVNWPSGIFGNSIVYPIYNAADPSSSEVRNTQISSTSITSTRCKSFDSAGAAIDCQENWLLVWGR